MGTLHPITQHKQYVPAKVRAILYYGIDPNLEEIDRAIYKFLTEVCIHMDQIIRSIRYCKWSTMEEAIIEVASSEVARDIPTSRVQTALATLRKNRYLRLTFNHELNARVMELLDFVGESARG